VTLGNDSGRVTFFESLADYRSSADLMRILCTTLLRSSPCEIESASLTINLTGKPGEARLLQAIGARLAEEYDLRHKVVVEGRTLTVRFVRKLDSSIRKE
jgi:hypothetical protein